MKRITRVMAVVAAVMLVGACVDDLEDESIDQELVPAGWTEVDINAPAGATGYVASTGALTLTSSGGAITGSTDSFRYVYRSWSGDGVVITRLAGLDPGTDWSAAGVMIRQSTASNAPHASLLAFSTGKLHFRYRTTAGGGTSTSGPASGYLAPQWLKVQRVGNVFNGFVSADGRTWTAVGTANVSIGMTDPVLVGIVAFRSGTAPIDADFDALSATTVSPWTSIDVGAVGIAGSISHASGVYTVRAAGTGVFGATDAFRYTYRPWTGDGEIVARVEAIDAAGAANALGGVMFRESPTNASARHASMLIFANGKAKFRWRTSTTTSGSEGPSSGVGPPRWVRLTRAGDTFTAYHGTSATGPWTGFAGNTATVPMSQSLYVGFAAAREGASALATVRVSGVATTGTTPTPTRRFKMVTWNLKHSDAGATAQADRLAAQNPDVIITQETHASAAATIKNRLGAAWKYRHFAGTASEGNAVFTRLETPAGVVNGEIVGDDRLIGPSTWGGNRYATRVTVRVGGTTDVSVFATHLDYPREGSTWDTHAQNRDLFVAWLDSFSGHKVWGGDLNAKTNGNAIQIATIAAFDARGIDSCRGFFNQTHAWCNSNYPTKENGTRFDYIYKTSGMTFRSHEVISRANLSDHDLVITIVEVP